MKGVVLAAGAGTRLRPHTDDRPKPMVHAAGKPILSHALDRFVDLDTEVEGFTLDGLVIVVGYCGDVIVDHYGDSYRGVPITYARQEPRDGLANAFLAAADHVDDDFVSIDGDGIVQASLGECVERHRATDADCVLLLQRVPAAVARSKAICRVNDAGEVTAIENKPDDPPATCRIATPFTTFSPAVFDACRRVERSPRDEYELSDAIETLIDEGTVLGVDADGPIYNVNTVDELTAVRERLGSR